MTFQDEAEVRRTSVGTKVLMFGCAILAVLGSFWSIVWFIRSYVEAPRVGIPAAIALAGRESTPVVPPARIVAPAPIGAAEAQPASPPPSTATTAESAPAAIPASEAAQSGPGKSTRDEAPSANGAIADRWLPMNPPAAEPAPAPAPTETAPAALATSSEPAIEEVVESSVPAIAGTAPLPRRKPTQTAAVRSRNDPPLPRPRPDGPAPQSVWTSVPVGDDRFPQQ